MQYLSVPHSFLAWLLSLMSTGLLKLLWVAGGLFAPSDGKVACREDVNLGGRVCCRGVAWRVRTLLGVVGGRGIQSKGRRNGAS